MPRNLNFNHTPNAQCTLHVVGTYSLSTICASPLILNVVDGGAPLGLALTFLGSISPSLIAFLMTAFLSGKRGVFELLSQAGRWRFSPILYLVILFLPPLATFSLAVGIGLSIVPAPMFWLRLPVTWTTAIVSPLGEEFGWRGFVLPRLQKRYSPFWASVILGIIWAGWHYWYFLISGNARISLPFGLFAVDILGKTMWYTWLYAQSRGSLLTAILFHGTCNLWFQMQPVLPATSSIGIDQGYAIDALFSLVTGLVVISLQTFKKAR